MRHFFAILALPVTVAVIVPGWLLHGTGTRPQLGGGGVVGLLLVLAGIALAARCIALFARKGRGTLAPWDPPVKLVVAGPYRHVRNPMIAGVLLVLLGEALLFRSTVLGGWAVLFFGINTAYFLLVEEPGLVRRFGDEYRAYRARTPLWLPRWPKKA